MKVDILENLNPMQREAVETIEGPVLILAGAGSGKTRVLTHRIANMLQQGIAPYNILAITFTNKAAREMKDRIHSLVDEEQAKNIWVGTFHSICIRILRREIDRLGYTRDFVIYDTDDQKKLMEECLKELNINSKDLPPKAVLGEISRAKDEMINPQRFQKLYSGDFKLEKIGRLYERYQAKLMEYNAVDFDDIILNVIELFNQYDEILMLYQNRFKYVMVDEYQDTNSAQYMLVQLFSQGYNNLCVVGDDDQCIYGWRGANIQNILDFEKDFPDTKVIKLEENYRSTQNILNVANHVVNNNKGRKQKKLWTNNNEGEKIIRYTTNDEREEARFVTGVIKSYISDNNANYKDFAILYRTNAQSRVFEEELMTASMPYKIYGGINFYGRKEIKDVLSYLRIIQNSNDNISFKRIINEPKRGIGQSTVDKLIEYGEKNKISAYMAIDYAADAGIASKTVNKLKEFKSVISDIRHMRDSEGPKAIMQAVISKSGYIHALELEDTDEAKTRIENIKEFISVATEFENSSEEKTLEAFLANISLVSDIDSMEDSDDVVSLMTLHSAKGLEFPCVFMVGVEDGIFPSMRAFDSPSQMEEERRLCYVGITRAMKALFITNSHSRLLYGSRRYNNPSRFLEELPTECINNLNEAYGKQEEQRNNQNKNSNTTSSTSNVNAKKVSLEDYKNGQRVRHNKFGNGTIIEIENGAMGIMLKVNFDGGGTMKLMAMYANLEIV